LLLTLAVVALVAASASAVLARNGLISHAAPDLVTCSTKWVQVPTAGGEPATTDFDGLSFDSVRDGWAVANNGLIERWNGTAWASVPADPAVPGASFAGVAAISPNNAWAVGTKSSMGGQPSTLIEHWNGAGWKAVSSPNQSATFGNELNSIVAVPGHSGELWAVGTTNGSENTSETIGQGRPLILHRTASGWTRVTSAPEAGAWHGGLRRVDAVSENEVWAVGSQNPGGSAADGPFTEVWNGSSWIAWASNSPGAGLNRMYGLTADSPTDVLAVGIYSKDATDDRFPLEEQWDGTRWNTLHPAATAGQETFLVDAASGGPTSTWAVGETGPTDGTPSTLIMHWHWTNWGSYASPNPSSTGFNVMRAVAVAPGGFAFASGDSNTGPFFVRECAAASITVSPTSGDPGSQTTVSGSGFTPGETVNLAFDAAALTSATADGNGTFTKTVTIPSGATLGAHTLTATGATSNHAASATFTVSVSWSQFHRSPGHAGENPLEASITSGTAQNLLQTYASASIGATDASPAVVAGVAYIGSESDVLYALDAGSGAVLWRASGSASAAEASPAVADGFVFVGADDGTLEAFPAGGCGSSTCAPAWTATVGDGTPSSPAVSGNVVYVGGSDGRLYAFDAHGRAGCATAQPITCQPLWTAQTSGGALGNSPAIDRGKVFVHAADGSLEAFDVGGHTNCSGTPKTCTPEWRYSKPTYGAYSSPAAVGGVVYFGSGEGNLYAVNEATGKTHWVGTTPTGSHLQTSPAVGDGFVYIGSLDGHLYAYSTAGCGSATCAPSWSFNANNQIDSSPSVAADVVYFASNAGDVFALKATGGSAALATLNCGAAAPPLIDVSSPVVIGGTVFEPDSVAGRLCGYTLH
jgi:outer membrane protein assembly factor BamB